jgi:serine/threonine-protein kinase PknK
MLERIAEQDLFLTRQDDDPRWFRYHSLFLQFLRRHLRQRHPDRIDALHAVACDWFAAHDMLPEAVDHALAAHRPDEALRLIVDHGARMLQDSRMATFLGLLAKLPAELAASNPRLQLDAAWARVGLQRPVETRAALSHVDTAMHALADDDPAAPALRIEAEIARAAMAVITDRFDGLPRAVRELLDGPLDPASAAALTMLANWESYYRFDFDAVRRPRRLETTPTPPSRPINGPLQTMTAHWMSGLAAYDQLDITAAETSLRTALTVARTAGGHRQATRLPSAMLGALLYHRNDLDHAASLLDHTPDLAPQGGVVEYLFAAYGTGARVDAARGKRADAERRLAEGMEYAQRQSLPRLWARMINERIRLGLPIPVEAERELDGLPRYQPSDNGVTASLAELRQDSAIRLLLRVETDRAAAEALRRAEQLVNGIRGHGRPRALLQAELTHACCLAAAGRVEEAADLVTDPLNRCAEQGLVRFVADAGPQLTAVIDRLVTTSSRLSPTAVLLLRHLHADGAS